MTSSRKPTAGFWITISLLAALGGYPLSIGPAHFIECYDDLPWIWRTTHTAFRPLALACGKSDAATRAVFWYSGLWERGYPRRRQGIYFPPGFELEAKLWVTGSTLIRIVGWTKGHPTIYTASMSNAVFKEVTADLLRPLIPLASSLLCAFASLRESFCFQTGTRSKNADEDDEGKSRKGAKTQRILVGGLAPGRGLVHHKPCSLCIGWGDGAVLPYI